MACKISDSILSSHGPLKPVIIHRRSPTFPHHFVNLHIILVLCTLYTLCYSHCIQSVIYTVCSIIDTIRSVIDNILSVIDTICSVVGSVRSVVDTLQSVVDTIRSVIDTWLGTDALNQ